ncbi:MAG TPA: kelch repeat-containing protein, partial [Candidatus Binataceae bacterium]|nr:kelch repeat-containing protein [Candidatus Binataceae bacterium]
MILLTDGSVLVHNAYGAEWRRLTPDANGEYTTGTWSPLISMHNSRQFFASGILKDGKLFAIGGEYSNAGNDTPLGEIYDPLTKVWSKLAKPSGFDWIHGDISCCVLPDGDVLLGCIDNARTAVWSPHHDSWREAGTAFGTQSPTKFGRTNEETWTLLRDGSVLTVEVFNPTAAEKYLPHEDIWVSAGSTPQSLIDSTMEEIGPAILLPDGRVFAIGGSSHTALYTPPHHHKDPGSWANGPDLKDSSNNLAAIDAPAVLLPEGKVLCCAGKRHLETPPPEYWSGPTLFFEYDPISNGLVETSTQPTINGTDTWTARLLLLPNGQVLYTAEQNNIWIYTPDGGPHRDWRPHITEHPRHLHRDEGYEIEGHRFNGLSQAVSYGDDYTAATNYPLVRLTKGNTVTYCRTHDFSTLAVATGDREVRTRFHVPTNAPTGDCHLAVVANGIASDPVHVHV